jgi:hypothetical protein
MTINAALLNTAAYYARDVLAMGSLGASVLLLILAVAISSRRSAFRDALTLIDFLALIGALVLCLANVERGVYLARAVAVELLAGSVLVFLISLVAQGYYAK